jgi:hypothetical protein
MPKQYKQKINGVSILQKAWFYKNLEAKGRILFFEVSPFDYIFIITPLVKLLTGC